MIQHKNIYVIPSYHGKLNFSQEVRKLFYEIKPDAIAVELPQDVRENVIKGINRLPKISMILFEDEILNAYMYIPIDPSDSIIEGVRLSLEHIDVSCYFIDLNVRAYTPAFTNLPDDQAIKKVGLDQFYDLIKQARPELFELDRDGFGGFPENYIDQDVMKDINLEEIKPKSKSLDKSESKPERKSESKPERKSESKPDRKLESKPDFQEDINSFNIENRTLTLDKAREYYMACNLKQLMESHEKVLFVVGLAHWERIKTYLEDDNLNMDVLNYNPEVKSMIYNVASEHLNRVFTEVPYFVYQWEKQWETDLFSDIRPFMENYDKTDFIPVIYLKGVQEYEKRYEERISIQQSLQLKQYMRNLVLIDGRLTPDIYHLAISAKNIIDDDFAWFVYKTSVFYPYAVDKDDDMPTIPITGDFFKLDGKYIRLKRRIPSQGKTKTLKLRRVKEEMPGDDWKKDWEEDKYGICSWPEEDIILEQQYQYIRSVGHRILTEKYTKTVKFTGSLLDGIDIRETLKNWHTGQNIYVKEIKRIEGSITSLIVIFDDEKLAIDYQPKSNVFKEKYSHNISFYAEHENESDLVFFSTEPGVNLIGPGISIIKLGGILSEFPPLSHDQGLFDCFDRSYNFLFGKCYWKSERLLMSAIYQSSGKNIIFIAKKRPKPYFYKIARKRDKEVVFIQASAISNSTLEKIKYMHILAGRYRRAYAKDYINLKKKFRF